MKKLHVLIPSLACAATVPTTLGVVSCGGDGMIHVNIGRGNYLQSKSFDGQANQEYGFLIYMRDWRTLVDPYFAEQTPIFFKLSQDYDPMITYIPMIEDSIIFKVDGQPLTRGSSSDSDYYYEINETDHIFRIVLRENGINKVENGQKLAINVKFSVDFFDCAFFVESSGL